MIDPTDQGCIRQYIPHARNAPDFEAAARRAIGSVTSQLSNSWTIK
jgi:hypothetical protein